MDLRLRGKVAVVTGGSLGIGRAVAEALAAEGVRVAILSRSPGPLDAAAAAITAATGTEVLAVPADVKSSAQIDAAMARVAATMPAGLICLTWWRSQAMHSCFSHVLPWGCGQESTTSQINGTPAAWMRATRSASKRLTRTATS